MIAGPKNVFISFMFICVNVINKIEISLLVKFFGYCFSMAHKITYCNG